MQVVINCHKSIIFKIRYFTSATSFKNNYHMITYISFSIELRAGNGTEYKENPLCNWITSPSNTFDLIECSSIGRYVTIAAVGSKIPLTLCVVNVLTRPQIPSAILCNDKPKQAQISAGYLILDGKCYLRHPEVSSLYVVHTYLTHIY